MPARGPTSSTRAPPPFKSGIPLPERLVPGGMLPFFLHCVSLIFCLLILFTVTCRAGESAGPSLPSQLPTRVGYTPDFTDTKEEDKEDDEELERDEADEGQPLENEPGDKKKVFATSSVLPNISPTASVPSLPQVSAYQTTPDTPELQASFSPPILVTPPSTPRGPSGRPLRRRPVARPPWKLGGDRIPRPPGQPPRLAANPQRPQGQPPRSPGQPSRPANNPSRPLRPQSGQPTPPLRTSQRPFVFPTASTSIRGGEPVIVTGVAIPAENDVIDLTVTAQQGFGGRRPPKKKYTGK